MREIDPTSIDVSAEYASQMCVGLYPDALGKPQLAVCTKLEGKCPATFDAERCMLLQPVGTEVTVGAKLVKF